MCCCRAAWRAGARGFVIDRAGHYETLTRLLDGAQQIEIGADDSPYALNPWDVPDPAKVSREKIAFLLALHQVMMGGLDARADRDDRRRDPRRLRQGRRAAGQPADASRCSRTSSAPRQRKRRTHDAVDVAATLRNLADRLSEYCGEGTYAYLLDRATTVPARRAAGGVRHPPLPGIRAATRDVRDDGVRHRPPSSATGRRTRPTASSPDAPLFLGRSIMLIDEAWHLISRPETGEYANDLARRARHLGLVLIVMSQQLSDFDTEYGVALLGNSVPAAAARPEPARRSRSSPTPSQLSEREAAELATAEDRQGPPRADAVAQRHPRTRQGRAAGRPDRVLGVHLGPDRGQAIREAEIARHDGNVWAAIAQLAKRGTRAHRERQDNPL